VREVVEFVQCPVSLVACSALSALSLACQALADVRRADKLVGPCSLYLLAVADSGERKTTCDNLFTLSIGEWEQQQAVRMEPELSKHAAAMQAWTIKREGVLQVIKHATKSGKSTSDKEGELERLEADKPQAPRVPSLIYGDTTPEALAWHLTQAWPSGGVLSSEAGIVFDRHGRGPR
jgi:putative DNA primase/helicase